MMANLNDLPFINVQKPSWVKCKQGQMFGGKKNASVNLLEVFVFSWIFALDNGSRGRLCLSAHSPPKNTNSAATTQCTNNW